MSQTTQGDTFTLFPLLPKELRVQIWNLALQPRIISFYHDRDRGRVPGSPTHKFMALTTLNKSIDIIPRVCAESLIVSRNHYLEWAVWDVRKNVSTTLYDPDHDVVYFSQEFPNNIDHLVLREFASKYPIQAKRIKTLALPPAGLDAPTISTVEILMALRLFEGLRELIVVLGHAYIKAWVASSLKIRTPGGKMSESNIESWVLPDGLQDLLGVLKKEKWPDWKIPKVSVANFLDEVLDS